MASDFNFVPQDEDDDIDTSPSFPQINGGANGYTGQEMEMAGEGSANQNMTADGEESKQENGKLLEDLIVFVGTNQA
jgi:hypothetical protein